MEELTNALGIRKQSYDIGDTNSWNCKTLYSFISDYHYIFKLGKERLIMITQNLQIRIVQNDISPFRNYHYRHCYHILLYAKITLPTVYCLFRDLFTFISVIWSYYYTLLHVTK